MRVTRRKAIPSSRPASAGRITDAVWPPGRGLFAGRSLFAGRGLAWRGLFAGRGLAWRGLFAGRGLAWRGLFAGRGLLWRGLIADLGLSVGPGAPGERPAWPSWPAGLRSSLRGHRRLPLLVLLALAVSSALALTRLWVAGGGSRPVAARIVPAVTFQNVGYRLLGVSITRRIAQRGARAISASGVFAIVKLGLRSLDGRRQVVSPGLLALDAAGTYYDPSSPQDIGLTDPRWGAVSGATPVPAGGSVTVKVVFDVAPSAFQRPVALRIGQFGPAGQAPPWVLPLTHPAASAAASRPVLNRERQLPARLVPDPVLGSALPS